jgi:3-methylfumaryl-CoA hydratase
MDQINVKAWEGCSQTDEGGISAGMAAQIHATLGAPRTPAPGTGQNLPPLWHWCAFPPTAPMDELGADGHPALGQFLPPSDLRRRMWAGGNLNFYAPLRVGERLQRRSVLRSVKEKQGKTGPMMFVQVEHKVYGERGLAVEERQDIVYLQIPNSYAPPAKQPLPVDPVLHRVVPMSETLLFRYSAITFNAHRIHYDQAYARDVEHYPGLVVHGPLQATLLMQAACAHKGRCPVQFDFRGVHPVFHGDALDIMAREDEDGNLALCTGQAGHQGMQAHAMWEGTL